MRTTLLFIFFFNWASAVKAQTPDSLGMDNADTLNRQELEVITSLLKEKKNALDLQSKKLAFVTGSSGKQILSKAVYFKTYIKPWLDRGSKPQVAIVALTKEEKNQSKGYDALVLSWVKLFTKKQRARIVRQLGKRQGAAGE